MWWFVRRRGAEVGNREDRDAGAGAGQQLPPRRIGREIGSEAEFLALFADVPALARHDAALKIWLPELPARLVQWLSGRAGISQSEWLRQCLTEYMYGRAACLAERIRQEKRPDEGVRFARAPADRTRGRYVYLVPELGKNTIAFKLWLGEQLRTDLSVLADHAGATASAFAREVIVAELLGRGSLPERPQIVGAALTDAALAWERGEDVPTRQVDESAFDGIGYSKLKWMEE